MARRPEHPTPQERDAARRYLEHDYASEHLAGEPRQAANRAAQELDDKHPRARDIALTGTERELGKLPPHLRRHQREARQRAGIQTEHAQRIRREYRGHQRQEPESEAERHRVAELAAGAGGVVRSGASAAADTSYGEMILDLFVWAAGLSIAYLMLTRVASVAKLFEGVTNAARALISPTVDPLNPGNKPPAAQPLPGAATAQASGAAAAAAFAAGTTAPTTTAAPRVSPFVRPAFAAPGAPNVQLGPNPYFNRLGPFIPHIPNSLPRTPNPRTAGHGAVP